MIKNKIFARNIIFIYEIFYKILVITKFVLISFIKYPIWIIIILASIILLTKYKFYKNNFFFITYFFLHIALIYLVYLKHTDINILIPLTLSRLIFPITGLYIFLILILLNKLKRWLKKLIYNKINYCTFFW